MPAPPTLPFGDFLAVLRARGFILGVENYLRLAHLLDRAGPEVAPAKLKGILAPIFATDAQEQAVFYEVFDAYFAPVVAAAAAAEAEAAAEAGAGAGEGDVGGVGGATPRGLASRRRRGVWIVVALTVFAAAIVGFVFLAPALRQPSSPAESTPPPTATPAEQTVAAPPAPAPAAPAPVSTPGKAATATPSPVIAPPRPIPVTEPRVSRLDRTRQFLAVHSEAAGGLALGVPLLLFLAGEWRRWRQRELLLDRAADRKPPRAWPVRITPPKIREYHTQPLFAAARALRRRQDAEIERLDLVRSLRATVLAGGLPRLVYRRGTRVPEYLVLIESASTRDHQAALFDQLAAALDREGVFLVRYFFRGDPRICWNAQGTHTLADLRRRHAGHRVLIFSEGAGLLDPVTGAPAAWLPVLGEWRERLLLTPAQEWGWREETLAGLLPVAAANIESIAAVPDLLEHGAVRPPAPGAARDVPASLRGNRPPTPALLREYLGPAAFEWLCACALYPELQWNLTLHLGAQLPGAEALLTEEVLLRLVRLPWLRAGQLPQDLRARLLADLPAGRQRVLRAAIVGLLESSPAPAGSHAADARQLDIAIQRRWLRRHGDRPAAPREPVSRLPFGEQTRDYAELALHEAGATPRLALLLPRRLRALLYDRATAALGFRPLVRFAFAALLAGAAWLGVRSVELPEKVSFVREFRLRHDAVVTDARFSPDGRRIGTAARDNTVKIWEASTGDLLATLSGLTAEFSPDGSHVATAAWGTAKVWDAETGEVVATLSGHQGDVNSAQFSSDGSRIVTASSDKTARVWELATGKVVAILSGHENTVWSAEFSPDGSRVVTASGDQTARIWETATGKLVATLRGHGHGVVTAQFSPDGSRIVTASGDTAARVWDGATGKLLATLSGHDPDVSTAQFSPDGARIVTTSEDNTVRVWAAATGKLVATLSGHEDFVWSAQFSPDGSHIVTASEDQTARVWDAATGHELGEPLRHTGGVLLARFNVDGSRIVTASEESAVVWRNSALDSGFLEAAVTQLENLESDLREAKGLLDGIPTATYQFRTPEVRSLVELKEVFDPIAPGIAGSRRATPPPQVLASSLEYLGAVGKKATQLASYLREGEHTEDAVRNALVDRGNRALVTINALLDHISTTLREKQSAPVVSAVPPTPPAGLKDQPVGYWVMNDALADTGPAFDGRQSEFPTGIKTDAVSGGATFAIWAQLSNAPAPDQACIGARKGDEMLALGVNLAGIPGYGVRVKDAKTESKIVAVVPTEADSKWHHLAATVDGAKGIRLYLDGKPAGSAAAAALPEDAEFFLGSCGGTNFAGGTLDAARIYGRVLDAKEIAALYESERAKNRTKPLVPPTPKPAAAAPASPTELKGQLAQATADLEAWKSDLALANQMLLAEERGQSGAFHFKTSEFATALGDRTSGKTGTGSFVQKIKNQINIAQATIARKEQDLSALQAKIGSNPAAPPLDDIFVVNVPGGDGLNVRAGPTTQSAIMAVLATGTAGIRITGSSTFNGADEWVPITYSGGAGWVRLQFLRTVSGIKPIPPGAKTYTARAGDTLTSVARAFGVSTDDLVQANFYDGVFSLRAWQVGTVLRIPSSTPAPTAPFPTAPNRASFTAPPPAATVPTVPTPPGTVPPVPVLPTPIRVSPTVPVPPPPVASTPIIPWSPPIPRPSTQPRSRH